MSICKRIWRQDGIEMVEEVWENQGVLRKNANSSGGEKIWGATPTQRAAFSDRHGLRELDHPMKIQVPRGWRCIESFRVDLSGAANGQTDKEGWAYQSSFNAMDSDLARGSGKAEDRPRYVLRRRRWVRSLLREHGNDEPKYHPEMEGWVAMKTISKNRIGRSAWKCYYMMVWPGLHSFHASAVEQELRRNEASGENSQNSAPTENVTSTVADKTIQLERRNSEMMLHNDMGRDTKNSGGKNRNLLSASFSSKRNVLRETYKKQKDRISNYHLGFASKGAEAQMGKHAVLLFWKTELSHDEIDMKAVSSQVFELVRSGVNRQTKNQSFRVTKLTSDCIVDDTIASSKEPGCFALHFPRKSIQILNAFTEQARLEWVEILRASVRNTAYMSNGEVKPVGLTRRLSSSSNASSCSSPRGRILQSAKSLSSSTLFVANPPLLGLNSTFSRSQPDVFRQESQQGKTSSLLKLDDSENESDNDMGDEPDEDCEEFGDIDDDSEELNDEDKEDLDNKSDFVDGSTEESPSTSAAMGKSPPLHPSIPSLVPVDVVGANSLPATPSSTSSFKSNKMKSPSSSFLAKSIPGSSIFSGLSGESPDAATNSSSTKGLKSLGKKLRSSFKHTRNSSVGSMFANSASSFSSSGPKLRRAASMSGSPPVGSSSPLTHMAFGSSTSESCKRNDSFGHRRLKSTGSAFSAGELDDDAGSETSSCVSGSPTWGLRSGQNLSVVVSSLEDGMIGALEQDYLSWSTRRSMEIVKEVTVVKRAGGVGLVFSSWEKGVLIVSKVLEGDEAPECWNKEDEEIEFEVESLPEEGDIILRINEQLVEDVQDVNMVLEGIDEGSSVKIRYCSEPVIENHFLKGRRRSDVPQEEKLWEIFEMFDVEIPLVFQRAFSDTVTYRSIQFHICSLLNVPSSVTNSNALRCWFRDQLDEYFDLQSSKYRILGLDVEQQTPVVALL